MKPATAIYVTAASGMPKMHSKDFATYKCPDCKEVFASNTNIDIDAFCIYCGSASISRKAYPNVEELHKTQEKDLVGITCPNPACGINHILSKESASNLGGEFFCMACDKSLYFSPASPEATIQTLSEEEDMSREFEEEYADEDMTQNSDFDFEDEYADEDMTQNSDFDFEDEYADEDMTQNSDFDFEDDKTNSELVVEGLDGHKAYLLGKDRSEFAQILPSMASINVTRCRKKTELQQGDLLICSSALKNSDMVASYQKRGVRVVTPQAFLSKVSSAVNSYLNKVIRAKVGKEFSNDDLRNWATSLDTTSNFAKKLGNRLGHKAVKNIAKFFSGGKQVRSSVSKHFGIDVVDAVMVSLGNTRYIPKPVVAELNNMNLKSKNSTTIPSGVAPSKPNPFVSPFNQNKDQDQSLEKEAIVTDPEEDQDQNLEKKPTFIRPYAVSVDLTEVARLKNPESKPHFYRVGDNKIGAFFDSMCVALLKKEECFAPEAFTEPAFLNTIRDNCEAAGMSHTFSEFGFEPIKVSVSKTHTQGVALQESISREQKRLRKQYSDILSVHNQCLSLAAAGINKRFFPECSPVLKEKLYEHLLCAGFKNPEVVIDAVFSEYSDEYNQILIDKASELFTKPLEIRNELARAIGNAGHVKTVVGEYDEGADFLDEKSEGESPDISELETDGYKLESGYSPEPNRKPPDLSSISSVNDLNGERLF